MYLYGSDRLQVAIPLYALQDSAYAHLLSVGFCRSSCYTSSKESFNSALVVVNDILSWRERALTAAVCCYQGGKCGSY